MVVRPRTAALLRRSAAVLLVLAAGFAVLWAVQRRMIYFPFGEPPPPAQAGLPGAESITFTTDDELTLGGWFVPASRPEGAATVLVFNGNGGNRAMRAPLAARLSERGMAVLLMDYRGYGENPGAPSEEGLARDARAARAYLATRAEVDPSRLVYFGESLGTAVAVRLAAEAPPLALVLRSPFTSLVDVGRHHYPWLPVGLLLTERFAAIDRMRAIRCPVLVIAAEEDTIVPRRFSERLYAAANEPKRLLVLPGVDHNDAELFMGARMIDAVVEFVGEAVARREQP